jgi:SHS2 domain-containing protein
MKIEGATVQELFSAGLKGMGNILKNDACSQNSIYDLRQNVHILSTDYTCLLVDFLSEVLSFSYTEGGIFCHADFRVLTPNEIRAEIKGIQTNSYDEEIKAVTYHEANVEKKGSNIWISTIIFDI